MARWVLTLMAGLLIASVAACAPSSTGSAASPSISGSAASPSAAATTTPTPTGSIAECTDLTSQDATQLAGVTFGAGTKAGLNCVYKNGNTVVLFRVAVLPNSRAVQMVKLQLQKAGYKQIRLPGADFAFELFQSGGGPMVSFIEVARRYALFWI
jgi:hypothetical protein